MKLEKKTMATLLAAVLIAMMGVMPALAVPPSDTSTLTATVLPTMVGITVDDVSFGTVTRGSPASSSLMITIIGEDGYTAVLSASLVDDSPAFYAPLTLVSAEITDVEVIFASDVLVGPTPQSFLISFNVPSGATVGSHTGTLTIFAVYTS